VREHCAACPECGRAWREAAALWSLVDDAPAPALPRSIWPGVRRRLATRPSRGARWSFAAAAAAACLVGLLLGVRLGSVGAGDAVAAEGLSLPEQGALLVEGGDTTLDRIYLTLGADDEEVRR
jgi:ferric-dicitrate binding protein FerR (iron transport regulator)